ncbi:hypothetical protein ACFVXG_22300 [Kitasatospora sp. NPDC058162]|uniref:hypothetical protein n=1 Tax=Kitasatospora sp. NPDC058162 TaxID=3346362 RepID=UPI0036D95858
MGLEAERAELVQAEHGLGFSGIGQDLSIGKWPTVTRVMPEQARPIEVQERFRKFLVTDGFDRYGLEPGRPTPTPQFLQVELTDLCNLACAGCVRAVHNSSGGPGPIPNSPRSLWTPGPRSAPP